MYGSNTWDLFSANCQKLFTSYNVAVRKIFNLPPTSHRYLLECLTGEPHLYVQLLSRYVTFVQSLLSGDCFEVRFLASLCISDVRTVLGRSMRKIADLCNHKGEIEALNAKAVKSNVSYAQVPNDEKWRIGVVQNMQNVLSRKTYNYGLTTSEAKSILDHVCCS